MDFDSVTESNWNPLVSIVILYYRTETSIKNEPGTNR